MRVFVPTEDKEKIKELFKHYAGYLYAHFLDDRRHSKHIMGYLVATKPITEAKFGQDGNDFRF